MNYEKAYKEALERARNIRFGNPNSATANVVCEEIFPELKESEDERIRKEIKKDAEAWYKEHYEGENPQGKALMISAYIDGAIAWLEKQGNYNKLVEEIKERKELLSKEKEKAKSANDRVSLGGRIAMLEELLVFANEKQGEQKLINENLKDTEETMMYQGEVYTRVYKDELDKFANKYPKTIPYSSKKYAKYSDTDLVIAVKAGAEWQMKQNRAWSEENERMYKAISIALSLNDAKEYLRSWYTTPEEADNWLKSLKNRVGCAIHFTTTKQWSEDDEKILGKCIDAASGYYSPEDKQSMKDWLKSLKDRVQPQQKQEWSKEDEKTIDRIYNFIWKNRKGDTSEIYQQEKDANWLLKLLKL